MERFNMSLKTKVLYCLVMFAFVAASKRGIATIPASAFNPDQKNGIEFGAWYGTTPIATFAVVEKEAEEK
jgi:hypothetical protein